MGQRVQGLLIVLVCGVAEHDSLVSRSDVLKLLVTDDSVGNVGVLGLDHLDDVHLFSTHAALPRVEADSSDSLACDGLEVNLLLGAGDFSHQAECFRFGTRFHGNSGRGVDLDAGINDSIGYLITHLIRMALSD
jgi:hypothetical protein